MSAKIIEIVILESIAAVLLLLAYLIGVKRKLNLIAGYGERTAAGVKGKDALARLIARACFLVALLSGLMPIATSLWGPGALRHRHVHRRILRLHRRGGNAHDPPGARIQLHSLNSA